MSKLPFENRTFTCPEVAKYLRISPEKCIGFIRSGELKAFNVGKGKTKPRYRISQQAIDDFEASRLVITQPKTTRRKRRRDPSIIEFF